MRIARSTPPSSLLRPASRLWPKICPAEICQRVVIARELSRNPRLLVAYNPTRGLDVSNAEAMRQLLLRFRRDGVGILLVSENLHELFALSDRLLVMYHGRVVGDFAPQETDSHAVGHLMTGG